MSDLANDHRRVADVVEPLEQMGIDVTVTDRETDDGDLRLVLNLRIPGALDPVESGAAEERVEMLAANCEQLREARDRVDEVVQQAEDLEERITGAESRDAVSESASEEETGAWGDLTDGERETLHALRKLGGPRASGEVADEVDATLQSVRSWLPKLVDVGHVRAVPDPSDGRRKLYSLAECDVTSDEEPETVEGTVYIASSGGSPSQVFHIREDCPQLQKSADSVEKDRSVVPHHRPCGNCVSDGLEEGLVAVATGSQTTTYHKRKDCPKLGSAAGVVVQKRETVQNYDPCDDCVHLEERSATGGDTKDAVGEQTAGAVDEESRGDVASVERDEEIGSGDEESASGEDEPADDSTTAQICGQGDLHREEVVEALDTATAIYHVQRDLELSRDETEALLEDLGVFETLDGGGNVTRDRAKSVARKHVPLPERPGFDTGENDG